MPSREVEEAKSWKFFGRQYIKLRETILKAKYGFFIN